MAEPQPEDDERTDDLPKDELFHLLANQRRRSTLRYLNEHDEPAEMRELAEWVAARENETTVAGLRSKERQRVYIALYQIHLPQLAEHDVIEYNQSRGIIHRTELADLLSPYLDSEPNEAMHDGSAMTLPATGWTDHLSIQYNFGLIVAGIVTLAVGWFEVVPPIVLLTLTWIVLFVAISIP